MIQYIWSSSLVSGTQLVRGESLVIHNKPLSTLSEFMLKEWVGLVTRGTNQMIGLELAVPPHDLQGGERG